MLFSSSSLSSNDFICSLGDVAPSSLEFFDETQLVMLCKNPILGDIFGFAKGFALKSSSALFEALTVAIPF